MNTVKISQVFEILKYVIAAGESACLIGPSGCGKTQVVGQFAAHMGVDFVPVHLMSMSPEDAKFPIVDPVNESVTFVPARMFMANGKRKLFFWDELTHAPSMLQSMCYMVFEGNRLGDYVLPADSIHIAAHNRVADKGVHNRVPMPLRRRWYEFNVEPDLPGWQTWAVKNGIEPLVRAYLQWKPDHMYQDSIQDQLAPDPRAWAKISNLMTANPGMDSDLLYAMVSGKVGEGIASEFIAYLRLYAGLPDLNAILANPKIHVPGVTESNPRAINPALAYAVAAGLSHKATVANFASVIRFMDRVTDDFNVLCIKDAILRDKALQATPEMVAWAVKHQDVVL